MTKVATPTFSDCLRKAQNGSSRPCHSVKQAGGWRRGRLRVTERPILRTDIRLARVLRVTESRICVTLTGPTGHSRASGRDARSKKKVTYPSREIFCLETCTRCIRRGNRDLGARPALVRPRGFLSLSPYLQVRPVRHCKGVCPYRVGVDTLLSLARRLPVRSAAGAWPT